MSERPTPNGTEGACVGGAIEPLTAATIDTLLSDFRAWLLDVFNSASRDADNEPEPGVVPEVDLFTLVGQFTALRHEVNLQTKAARAAIDQNAEVLKRLEAAASESPDCENAQRSAAKAIIDIADALTLSLRQMEKFRDTVDELLESPPVTAREEPTPPGFFARLLGVRSAAPEAPQVSPVMEKLRPLAAAAADGYAMSLRRVERNFPTFELEPLACLGEVFDPEFMEVVEVIGDTGAAPGTVVEEVRPGYLWRGRLLRYAQVKVAR